MLMTLNKATHLTMLYRYRPPPQKEKAPDGVTAPPGANHLPLRKNKQQTYNEQK